MVTFWPTKSNMSKNVNKNIIINKDCIWIIDFDKCSYDYCSHDIAYFLRRLLKRPSSNWSTYLTLKVIDSYLENNSLNVELLGQGFTWLDTGTHESLVDATNFVKTMEQHQHRKIACLEEIAYLNGWISKEEVLKVYEVLKKNEYGQYLKDVLDGKYQENLY